MLRPFLIVLALSGPAGSMEAVAPAGGPPVPAPAGADPAASDPASADPTATLTLQEAIGRAISTNRDLRTARSRLLQARLGRSIAITEVYAPNLSAQYTAVNEAGDNGSGRIALTSKALGFEIEPYLRLGYTPWSRSDAGLGGAADGYETAAGVSISRRLFAIAEHLRQRLPLTQADLAIYAAANDLVLAGRQLEQRVTAAFFAVQSARARLAVRRNRIAEAKESLANVKDRIAHGFASPIDQLNEEINSNQADASFIDDRTAFESATEQLNDLLDRPLTTPLIIAPEPIDDRRIAAVPVRDLAADTDALLAGHESLGTAARQAELLALQLRIQRDNLWPDLKAAVNAERRADGAGPLDHRDSLGNVVSLTLTWTMPLDGWRADRARYAQIGKQIEDQELVAIGLRAGLQSRLRDAWRQVDSKRIQAALATRRLEIERLRLQATIRRYETGAVDNLEVTRAKQAVDDAEIAQLSARIDLLLGDVAYRALLPLTPTPVSAEAPEAGGPDGRKPRP